MQCGSAGWWQYNDTKSPTHPSPEKERTMANQTYQFVLTANSSGQFVQNVLHYRMDDDSFADRLLAAKGLIDGWIAAVKAPVWLAMLPEEYILKSLKARRVTNGGGPEWLDTSLDGEEGTAGSGAQMSGAGPTIIWNTDGGAKRVGKTFLSGIPDVWVNGGEITAAALSSLNALASAFSGSFAAVGGSTPTCTFCIPRSNDPSVRSLVVAAQVSKIIGQQRRRQLPV